MNSDDLTPLSDLAGPDLLDVDKVPPHMRELFKRAQDVELPDFTEKVPVVKCRVCGNLYPETHADDPTRCLCSRAKANNLNALEEMDPDGRMKLKEVRTHSAGHGASLGVVMGVVVGERRKGLLMRGTPGVGKTHILVGALRELLDAGRIATWRNFARLVTRIQESYSDPEGPTRTQIIDALARHEVVMLDDLGKERRSEDVAGIVYEIIDTLYWRKRVLLAATNLSEREMERRYDLAVVDRLRHMCEFIEIRSESRRGEVEY